LLVRVAVLPGVWHEAGRRVSLWPTQSYREPLGTAAPIYYPGFVCLVARVVGGGWARGGVDTAMDVDHPAARVVDGVVVVNVPIRVVGR
jgi:hypothetical protein